MSHAPTLNGQIIGQTERATRAVLDTLLAGSATSFEMWVTLNLVADGEIAVDALHDRLVTGLRIGAREARAAIDDVSRAGLAAGTDTLRLTDAGRARHDEIRDGIDRISERLYAGLATEDLATARRVLETITERARAELAG